MTMYDTQALTGSTDRGDTIYNCTTARFDGTARGLTHDEMRRAAPSIFATEAHDSRSARFRPIPTIEIVDRLGLEGFSPVAVKQINARQEGREDFTKHMIRFRRLDEEAKYSVRDTVCEIILKNANDGSAAYDLMAGMYRICCLNNLVVKTSEIDSIRVRHSGDAMDKVIDGTYTVLDASQKALAAPQDWPTIPMHRDAEMAFAEAAYVLRFADADGNVDTPIQAEQLLRPRRVEDKEHHLWNTFNVVQENVIRGGLRGVRIDTGTNRRRRMQTRAVNGIDQDIKLNKALFVLGEKMANIMKQAA